jgi:hypothetical protein
MKRNITLKAFILLMSSATKELEEFKFKTGVNLDEVEIYRESNLYLMYESLINQDVKITLQEFLNKLSSRQLTSIKFFNDDGESSVTFFDIPFEEFDKIYKQYIDDHNEECRTIAQLSGR